MSATTLQVIPNKTTVEIIEQLGPDAIVEASVQTLEFETTDSVEIIEVGIAGASGSENELALAKRTDFVTDLLIYRGEALPGTADSAAAWRIRRLTLGLDDDVTEEWADGNALYTQVWDDRVSLSYS